MKRVLSICQNGMTPDCRRAIQRFIETWPSANIGVTTTVPVTIPAPTTENQLAWYTHWYDIKVTAATDAQSLPTLSADPKTGEVSIEANGNSVSFNPLEQNGAEIGLSLPGQEDTAVKMGYNGLGDVTVGASHTFESTIASAPVAYQVDVTYHSQAIAKPQLVVYVLVVVAAVVTEQPEVIGLSPT